MRLNIALVGLLSFLVIASTAQAEPSPPLPGGPYVGETGKGKRIKVKVRSASTEATLRGKVKLPCAGVRARFTTDDGTFVAKKVNGRGKLVLRVKGSFAGMSRVSGEVKRLKKSKRHGKCRPASFGATLATPLAIESKTISYGPFHTEPTGGHGGGHNGGGGHNVGLADLEKPCEGCHVVGMVPNLTYADGSTANFDNEAMLHHVVFSNLSRPDATCENRRERFFASGNERIPFVIPRGYGYRIDAGDRWRLITHIMNMGDHEKELFIDVTFYYVDGDADLTAVKPFWLDIDNCGNSEYTTPEGVHTEARTFEVAPEWSGEIVAIGGHLHDHGEALVLTDQTRKKPICGAAAGYGTDPSYMGHIEDVGGCTGRPVASISPGDRLRLASRYDAPEAIHDVMGIMVGYVAPGD